jgi:hypothetical protein
VVNIDTAAHNVSAVAGGFETRTLAQGASATFTAPATPGRYAFRCTVHPEMTGTLVVAGAPAADDRPAGSRSAPTTSPPRQQPGGGR